MSRILQKISDLKVNWINRKLYDSKVAIGIDQLLAEPLKRVCSLSVYSQYNEDGVILSILSNLDDPLQGYFCDIGCATPYASNVTMLAVYLGWTGLMFDMSGWKVKLCRQFYSLNPRTRNYAPEVFNERVDFDKIDTQLDSIRKRKIRLMSIDIDSFDFWVFKNLSLISPDIVVVEANTHFDPHTKIALSKDADPEVIGKGIHHGASISAYCEVAEKKGYTLVATNLHNFNLFFVKKELLNENLMQMAAEQQKRLAQLPTGLIPIGNQNLLINYQLDDI